MKKTGKTILPIMLILIISVGLVVAAFFLGRLSREKSVAPVKAEKDVQLFIGDVPIAEYEITADSSGKASAELLSDYIEALTGVKLPVKQKAGGRTSIFVTAGTKKSGITANEGKITIGGTDKADCLKEVYFFINRYLGYAFAGTEREHILRGNGEIHIPEHIFTEENPYIAEREPIICLWKTNVPRGQYFNTKANLSSEIMSYSDDELYNYVRMMGYLGYTGIQVTDMCANWAQYGGYEFVHDRIRLMADAAHSLGMNFTLWVWGAEFNGYGWIDDSVKYFDYSKYRWSYECPEALATFEKYYKIYAELADCADRVIMHFDDPSYIHASEDIAYYAKMFQKMVTDINPDIKFGVSDYTGKFVQETIKEALGDNMTTYIGAKTHDGVSWVNLRTTCLVADIDVGIWSWNLGEHEIDQHALVCVNPSLIKKVITDTAAEGDSIKKPTYWSEMDSYHNANIFSLYCAARLLENPDEDADELLYEIAQAVVGKDYSQDLFEILKLVEEARTGENWNTFKLGFDGYLLTDEGYPAEDIAKKCSVLIPKLDEMIAADIKSNRVPMAISVSELLHLYRVTLEQINSFADFRVSLSDLYEDLDRGVTKEQLKSKLTDIYRPVYAYDSLIGVWGQPEALAQLKLVLEFSKKAGIEAPEDKVYFYNLKQYLYGEICAYQQKVNHKYVYIPEENLWSSIVGKEYTDRLIRSLVEEGLLQKEADGGVSLTNYEEYLLGR